MQRSTSAPNNPSYLQLPSCRPDNALRLRCLHAYCPVGRASCPPVIRYEASNGAARQPTFGEDRVWSSRTAWPLDSVMVPSYPSGVTGYGIRALMAAQPNSLYAPDPHASLRTQDDWHSANNAATCPPLPSSCQTTVSCNQPLPQFQLAWAAQHNIAG
ncbi:hypothetical protein GQ53DRAFT_417915 [Thozetella sp. PMI_491]|nr:hypothetical protein GQ53DRAFT_417915 [Thozetella sp. PMI_491]